MDVVVAGLFSLAIFMVIFVPVAQRLLGVRFGLIRMALGAALTLTVFSPIANALVGTTPFEGSKGDYQLPDRYDSQTITVRLHGNADD